MMEVARNSNQPLQPIPYDDDITSSDESCAQGLEGGMHPIKAAKIAANKATAHTAVCSGVIGI